VFSSTRSPRLDWKRSALKVCLAIVPLSGAATYLFAPTRMDPLVTAAVLWHVVGGALLGTGLFIILLRRRAPVIASVGLAASLASGLALIVSAALGQNPSRVSWVFILHLWIGFFILAGLCLYGLTRASRRDRLRSSATTASAMMLISVAALGATTYRAEEYYRALTATNPRQAQNPLFPAGAKKVSGDWPAPWGGCGAEGCHPKQYQTSLASVHARAAHLSIMWPKSQARWCAGCHGTSQLLGDWKAGRPEGAVESPGSYEAVTCLACHTMSHAPSAIGNGTALYSPPARYPFADSRDPLPQWMNGFLLRLRPLPHVATLTPLRGEKDPNAVCAPCHRMAVNVSQNQYRFLRYDDTWAEWQRGPFSGESLHSLGIDRRKMSCIDCHMPRDAQGKVDHSCRAGEASLTPDRDLRVEIFALRRGQPERLDAPLADRPASVPPGTSAVVDVLIENRGVGHAFPAATKTGREVWLEFEMLDAQGRRILASPRVAGRPDEMTHLYGQMPLDRKGAELSSMQKDRVVADAYRRFIGAGESDVAHFRVSVPQSLPPGDLKLQARLVRREAGLPDPRILARHEVSLAVQPAGKNVETPARVDNPQAAHHFYAYASALLLQGDNGRARRMFLQASPLASAEPAYLVGAARASITERDMLGATASLNNALKIQPNMPEARLWLGAVYRESGQFRRALDILNPLSERFPRDAQLWSQIGLCRLQIGDGEGAARAFESALAIDPDDASAHYNLMQSYLRQKKASLARREETVFRALQEDEPLRAVLDPYYASRPGARLESLAIHEHSLAPERRATR
jgi:tetratricopeptide (TPR) repeat protein